MTSNTDGAAQGEAWQSLGGKGIINAEGERRLWAIECMDDLNADHRKAQTADVLAKALEQVRDACFNGPLSTDADGLAVWWEGFDGFVAETVMPALAQFNAATEAPSHDEAQ